MPRKEFESFTRLDASDVNTFLMDQSVMSFAGTAARGSAIATPVEGMVTYLEDSDDYEGYNGSAWIPLVSIGAWKTWAPVLSGGWANGNGTYNYAKYAQIGKTVHVAVFFTLGSTTTKGASLEISLPVAPNRPFAARLYEGVGKCNAGGTNVIMLVENIAGNDKAVCTVLGAAGTYANITGISATVPGTWVTGNTFMFNFTYEAE
jgi:hypothetical protein